MERGVLIVFSLVVGGSNGFHLSSRSNSLLWDRLARIVRKGLNLPKRRWAIIGLLDYRSTNT